MSRIANPKLAVELRELDFGTADLAISEVVRANEMQAWFVAEHLVDTPLVRARETISCATDATSPAVGRGDADRFARRAAKAGFANTVSVLLEHGADPSAVDDNGRTPLDCSIARRSRSTDHASAHCFVAGCDRRPRRQGR